MRVAAYRQKAALLALGALWRLRERLGRAPFAAAVFFLVTLAPVLGFLDIYYFRYQVYVTDHWNYLSSLAVIVPIVAWVTPRLRRASWGRWAWAGLLVVLGALTIRQASVYESRETIWRDTIAKNPDAWLAHNNLGGVLAARGDAGQALFHWRAAIRINPRCAEAQVNVGLVHLEAGRLDEAIGQFRLALDAGPDYSPAHTRLGIALDAQGNSRYSIVHYREAIRLNPRDAVALNNLAWTLATHPEPELRDGAEAVALALRAQAGMKPTFVALDTLAAAYAEAGRFDEAVSTAERSLRDAATAGVQRAVDETRARLQGYQLGRPYREPRR